MIELAVAQLLRRHGKEYPLMLPPKVTSGITYQKTHDSRDRVSDGVGTLFFATFDVSCWAKRYSGAKAAEKKVVDGLLAYQDTVRDIYISQITLEFSRDDYESDTKLYRALLGFRIAYNQNEE